MSEPSVTLSGSPRPVSRNHPVTFPSASRLTFCGLTAFCLCLILRNSDVAFAYMSRGLSLCARTVIPSLFPFLVMSELLVASGAGELLGRFLEKPCRWLFGISGHAASALLMGLICGFPVGTRTGVSLYRRGLLDRQELSRLLCFCNVPSPAFLISTVGVSLFSDRRLGLGLWVTCLLSAWLTALLLKLAFPLPEKTALSASLTSASAPDEPHPLSLLTHAVTGGAAAMLNICAYVVFFSALSGTLGHLLTGVGAGSFVFALTSGLLELSGGVDLASLLPDHSLSLSLIAFLCGWSGLSVHLQIWSLCDGIAVKKSPFLISKLAQGVLNVLLLRLIL